MKIAIILIQKNETKILKLWFAYHSFLINPENIFIFDDNSTNDLTLSLLNEFSLAGANITRSTECDNFFKDKGNTFTNKVKQLDSLGYYDFYFPMDCDEFLCVNVDNNVSFEIFDIINELSLYQSSKSVLRIGCTYDNSPCHLDYYLINFEQKKCFFRSFTIDYIDNGYHEGYSLFNGNKTTLTNISYIHLHYREYFDKLFYSMQKLINRVSHYSYTGLINHKYNKGPGFHLVDDIVNNKNAYYSQFNMESRIFIDGLSNILNLLNLKLSAEIKDIDDDYFYIENLIYYKKYNRLVSKGLLSVYDNKSLFDIELVDVLFNSSLLSIESTKNPLIDNSKSSTDVNLNLDFFIPNNFIINDFKIYLINKSNGNIINCNFNTSDIVIVF